ncbi:hypothetical protein TSUD_219210 [Trifolium subterraneum]|uniref:Uncharacterized protein n=1 Tax=Trifolium subterraneum TaxID=3900 RepID=A0A2Z6MQ47_TRISU|nr:hypothetical protein TSUD_219210 [Trifolium subterraneum]
MGNGEQVNFWLDKWMTNGHSLINHSTQQIVDTTLTVKDTLTYTGEWDINFLTVNLPLTTVNQLVAIPALKDTNGVDSLGWSGTNTRHFTVQSAYNLQQGDYPSIDGKWKSLWSWKGPHRIQTFMWIAAHERLLTNYRRSKWRSGISPTCPMDWIFDNMTGAHNKEWQTIFMMRADSFEWLASTKGYCFYKLEAASRRMDQTRFFARKIGSCDALHAEMWGMYIGIDLARRQGITHLQVESDSKVLVEMVTGNCNVNGNIPTLLKRIRDLINMNWDVQINHTWREGNKSADWLANYSLTLNSFDLHVLETPLRKLQSLLFYDFSGTCMPRNVRLVT